MMAELALPWPVLAALVASALGGLFGLVLHTRKALSDLRVELADYKTQVAERYVPFAAQAAFEDEVVRRLERIEDLLHQQLSAAPRD